MLNQYPKKWNLIINFRECGNKLITGYCLIQMPMMGKGRWHASFVYSSTRTMSSLRGKAYVTIEHPLTWHAVHADHVSALKESVLHKDMSKASGNAVLQVWCHCHWHARCVLTWEREHANFQISITDEPCHHCKPLRPLGKMQLTHHKPLLMNSMGVIADTINEDIDSQLQNSRYLSIMTDENTDVKITKKLVIYARYITDDMQPKTFFLGNISLQEISVTAEVFYNSLKDFMERQGINPQKIVGFGSDRASIMTGKKNGCCYKDAGQQSSLCGCPLPCSYSTCAPKRLLTTWNT